MIGPRTSPNLGPGIAGATPLPVQILATLFYGAFAIVATVLAFVWFWPAGFALAVIIAWRGFHPAAPQPVSASRRGAAPAGGPVAPGNAAFDAYRAETLARLEAEKTAFDGFLSRLRAARDKVEFDRFIDDRAVVLQHPGPLGDDDPGRGEDAGAPRA